MPEVAYVHEYWSGKKEKFREIPLLYHVPEKRVYHKWTVKLMQDAQIDGFRSISLSSGAQGLDMGLSLVGIDMALGQDVDLSCAENMARKGQKGMTGDIRSIEAASLPERSGLGWGEPFLVCGGPPCQSFSTAAKRMGINDLRGSLFMDFVRMMDEMRPRFFITGWPKIWNR